jgi:hypothetical protein
MCKTLQNNAFFHLDRISVVWKTAFCLAEKWDNFVENPAERP